MSHSRSRPNRNSGTNSPSRPTPSPLAAAPTRSTPAIPWWERPYLTVEETSGVLGCSRGQVYNLARSGSLSMARNNGRTLVTNPSVLAQLARARPYVPSGADPRGAALVRARRRGATT